MKYFTDKISFLKQKGKQLKTTLKTMAGRPQMLSITSHLSYVPSSFGVKQCYQHCINNFKKFFIWDFQQKHQQFFTDRITKINLNGQPILTLTKLLELCKEIKNKINLQYNVVLRGVECSLLLSVFLYLQGRFQFLEQALIQVNIKLKINKDQTQYKTQHSYLKNIINLFAGLKTYNKSLLIKTIRFPNTFVIKTPSSHGSNNKFNPIVYIYSGQEKLNFKTMRQVGKEIIIEINHEILDDIMILIKHQANIQTSFPCFRFILNTNFIFSNQVSINLIDMDVSKTLNFNQDFNVKVQFQQGKLISNLQQSLRNTLSYFNKQIQQIKQNQPTKQIKKQSLPQQTKPNQIKQQPAQKLQQKKQDKLQQDKQKQAQQLKQFKQLVDSFKKQNTVQMVISDQVDQADEEAEDVDDYIRKLEESINN